MTDRITATLAVIEAREQRELSERGERPMAHLDDQIAAVLPCGRLYFCIGGEHDTNCPVSCLPAVRELIVALLASHQGEWDGAALQAAHDAGFEQAREQAARIALNNPFSQTTAYEAIRSLTPDTERG